VIYLYLEKLQSGGREKDNIVLEREPQTAATV
jgi:hypothetical protein